MVIVMEKKMAVLMAVMVVAVVGGHFDPKIRIWNSCLSSPPAPQPLPHPAPSDSLGPGGSSQDQPIIGTLDTGLDIGQQSFGPEAPFLYIVSQIT